MSKEAVVAEVTAVDMVNHPPHYSNDDPVYEPINVIEAWGLGFHLGNTVKYIARAGKKGSLIEDLKKARWYLTRKIEREEKQAQSVSFDKLQTQVDAGLRYIDELGGPRLAESAMRSTDYAPAGTDVDELRDFIRSALNRAHSRNVGVRGVADDLLNLIGSSGWCLIRQEDV